MKFNFLKLNSFKKILKNKKGFSDAYRDVRGDWKKILLSFVAVSFFLAGLSGYLFYKINNGDIFMVEKRESHTVEVIDKKALDAVVGYFEEKKSAIDSINQNETFFADPSI
jgi:hypothetical protein